MSVTLEAPFHRGRSADGPIARIRAGEAWIAI